MMDVFLFFLLLLLLLLLLLFFCLLFRVLAREEEEEDFVSSGFTVFVFPLPLEQDTPAQQHQQPMACTGCLIVSAQHF